MGEPEPSQPAILSTHESGRARGEREEQKAWADAQSLQCVVSAAGCARGPRGVVRLRSPFVGFVGHAQDHAERLDATVADKRQVQRVSETKAVAEGSVMQRGRKQESGGRLAPDVRFDPECS